MQRIKVTSIEQLNGLLEKGECEFVIASGCLRSSKDICKCDDFYSVYNYIDDSTEELTEEQLLESNIGAAMRNGNLYCEIYK